MRLVSHRALERLALLALGLALGGLLAAHPALASLQQPSTTPIAWVAPEGVVQLSPCVPTMGEHWANPAHLPMGPIYTVHNGRLISIEYMPAQADFAAGKSWNDLTFRYWGQQLPIEHADMDYLPAGHEGYEVPHYDMHFYVVGHPEDREIACQP
jgi:hypothetical protein